MPTALPKPEFLKRQCWDSAMFITLALKQETDAGRERVETIKELLILHEKRKIEIVVFAPLALAGIQQRDAPSWLLPRECSRFGEWR